MLEQPPAFGTELRRLRIAAGFTLTQFASSVHYSKSQISKVETGHKRPTTELARLCDTALGANGVLAALVPVDRGRRPEPLPSHPALGPLPPDELGPRARDETGVMHGIPDDSMPNRAESPRGRNCSPADWPPSRRQAMAVGAASLLGTGAASGHAAAFDTGAGLLDAARGLFDYFRRIGQLSPPGLVLPALSEQTRALCDLAKLSGPRTRTSLFALSARFAEFAGWMAQEAGDDAAALRWTDHAVELAEAAGDTDLASYALVRKALITYYGADAARTVALAEGAYADRLPPRIRGLAAQRAAQGHALSGNHRAALRSLDRARDLLAADRPDPAAPVLGPSHLSDPVAMVTGWCLFDLGMPRQAAEAFDRAYGQIPEHALRTHARYGVRRALAHAVAGEIDRACELTGQLLPSAACVGSATITADLRRLARTLSRHPRHPGFLAVWPQLTAVLAPPGS